MNDAKQLASASQRLRQRLAEEVTSQDVAELLTLGAGFDQAGDREATLAAFEGAARLAPGNVSVWHAIAALRIALGRPKAALAACNDALRLIPDDPDTLFNTAVVLEALGDRSAALHCYRRALAFDATHFGALLNQVPLLLADKHLNDALAVSNEAIRLYPDNPDCWFNHGEVMTTASRHGEALDAYERALALQPACAKADIAAAVSEAALGWLEKSGERLSVIAASNPQALANFRSPLETDRESVYPELEPGRIALISAYQRYRICDWTARAGFVLMYQRVVDGKGCKPLDNPDLPFLGIGLPLPGEYRLRAARQVARRIQSEAAGKSLIRNPRRRGARLRIGYISGDFRQHALAYLMSRLPGLHDRKRFEVFVYSSGPDDQSAIRGEIVAGADHFCDVAHFDAHTTAQRIAMDGIDILVDLSGYTLHARPAALAFRPAPIQVSYLGYLQTMGAPWIDYALLDRTVLTAVERPFWQEKIAYLPHTFDFNDDRLLVPDSPLSRDDAGLPEGGFVFCCLNAAWKIDPETFACWMRILHHVHQAVLWLYDDLAESSERLRKAADLAGISPERLVFASRVSHAQHCARFHLADVFLDTFSCSAHTTCIEALAAGLPVVTMPGETVMTRTAASLLLAHGIPELLVNDQDDYVAMACRLAKEPDWLAELKMRVLDRSESHLFCTERRVGELECAFEIMWTRHQSGLATEDFDVPAISAGSVLEPNSFGRSA